LQLFFHCTMHIRSYEEEVHATRGQKPAKTFSESTSLQSCTTSVNPVQGGDKSQQDKFHSLGPLKMGPIHLRKHIEHDTQLTQSFSIADHPKFAKNKTVEEQLVNTKRKFFLSTFCLIFYWQVRGTTLLYNFRYTKFFSFYSMSIWKSCIYVIFFEKCTHSAHFCIDSELIYLLHSRFFSCLLSSRFVTE